MRRLGFLVFDNANLLDIAGPLQVFATASEQAAAAGIGEAYDLEVIAADPGLVRTSAGIEVDATGLDRIEPGRLDTLFVCGGHGAFAASADPRLIAWIKQMESSARRVGSICTGAFLLAAAGLLEGRRATTHWDYLERLARDYPGTHLEADSIFVRDGKFWTSAGVTAGLDMALAMVESDLGHSVALATARRLVFYLRRPGGQSQFSIHLDEQRARTPKLQKAIDWIINHPKACLNASALAAASSMSDRSLHRAFQLQLGTTPAEFVRRHRVALAKRLLEQSDDGLKRVAHDAGFRQVAVMDRAFRCQLKLSPSEYRDRFSVVRASVS